MKSYLKKLNIVYLILLYEHSLLAKNSPKLTEIITDHSRPELRNLPPESDLLWPDKRIPYIIDDKFGISEKKIISNAIDWWHLNTCIRWVKRNVTHKDFVNIVIGDNCTSPVGRIQGEKNITLGQQCFNNNRTIFHEMMHTIGFIHEHQRPDRDDYVYIYKENIDPKNYDINFRIQDKRYFFKGYNFPYDIHSIMHYTENMGSYNTSTGKKTIEAKCGKLLNCLKGENCYPTQLDIMKVNAIYRCCQKTKVKN